MASLDKPTAGKRIEFSDRDGYTRKARSAVMTYNCGDFWLPKVFEDKSGNDILKRIPKLYKQENRRKHEKSKE